VTAVKQMKKMTHKTLSEVSVLDWKEKTDSLSLLYSDLFYKLEPKDTYSAKA
jgi:hypothetical protein